MDAFEVLRRPLDGIGRVLVIGGGIVGVGVAHVLAVHGVEVAVAEALRTAPDGPPVFLVGDCLQPRTALEAMHETAALGHRL